MEFFYRKGSQGYNLACAYCRNPEHPNHRNGYVMSYSDGARVLIGKDCGFEYFGQREFQKMVDGLKAKNDRRSLLLRRASTLDAFPNLLAGLRSLLNGPELSTYTSLQRSFRTTFPLVSSMLNQAVAAHHGVLHYYVKVPDQAAMSEREERREQEAKDANKTYIPDRTPILRDDERRLGVVRSGDFFRDGEGAHVALGSLYAALEQVAIELPATSATQELLLLFRRLRDTVKAVEEQLDRVDRLGQSLAAENLRLLADWATRRKIPGTYKAGTNHLEHITPDGEVQRLSVPQGLARPDRTVLRLFVEKMTAAG